ncbi:MAG: ComEC/Rec2 family competence protein, partial [Clostridiales bacterium]|nr:ComEC/Rec2 family competence protein [Clostridiales bacterium]
MKTEFALKRPVLWALFFLIFGIIIGGTEEFFLAGFIFAIFLCVFLYRIYKYWLVILFAAFFLLGAWRIESSLRNHTIQPKEFTFSGIVLDTSFTASGNVRAVVRGIHPDTNERVRIMAYIQPHQPQISLGQEVTLSGEFLPLNPPEYPGGYNQFRHLRTQKIDATIWPSSIETGEITSSLMTYLRRFRDKIAAVYDGLLPPREAAVIKSMVLGDRLEMPEDLSQTYRVMGIYHILSISGLHITVLMLAANKLLAYFMRERRASFIVLLIMILYCLMSGVAVATVR